MPVFEPREYAAVFLLVVLVLSLLLCRRLAARSSRPAMIWAPGGYWALLHLVGIYGLVSSTRFENGLAPLSLLTFPLSVAVSATIRMEGFARPADLAINYLRYFVCCGGLNVLLIAGFVVLLSTKVRHAPDHPDHRDHPDHAASR